MMNKNVRGAVSVFLVIIMLPTIVCCGIFTDLGRVYMSKAVAESSADLALNSLLANYDSALKDWYGMVASCQDIEEFYDISAEFFLKALGTENLSADDMYMIGDYYSFATGNDSVQNLLKTKNITGDNAMISSPENANLQNSAMLKKQIVEFMKYRAPIELTTGIIERIKNNEDGLKAGAKNEKNKDLVKKKEEFYKSEGDFLKLAADIYYDIMKYVETVEKDNYSNEVMQAEAEAINKERDSYREITRAFVEYLIGTSEPSVFKRYTLSLDTEDNENVYSGDYEDENSNKKYYVTNDQAERLNYELTDAIDNFYDALGKYTDEIAGLADNLSGEGDNQPSPVRWWAEAEKKVGEGYDPYKNLKNRAIDLRNAYGKVKGMTIQPENDKIFTESKKLMKATEALQAKYLTAGETSEKDKYLIFVNHLESVSAKYEGSCNPENVYVTVSGEKKNVKDAVSSIYNEVTAIKGRLDWYILLLDTATGNLDKLSDKAAVYAEKLKAWKQNADTKKSQDSENQLAAADVKEISEMEDFVRNINKDKVEELKTRLLNIKEQIKGFRDNLDKVKIGNKKIIDINNFFVFKDAVSNAVDKKDIGYTNAEVKSKADSCFDSIFHPASGDIIPLSNMSDPNYNVVVNPRMNRYAVPELLKYFDNKLKNNSEFKKEAEKAEKENNKKKDEAKEKKYEAKNRNRYSYGGADIPHSFAGDDVCTILKSATGIFNICKDLLTLDIADIRDDLYVTSYMMNMFSFATYEKEGYYKLCPKADRKNLTISNHQEMYKNYEGSPEKEKTWLSTSPKDAYNKSLTNNMINKTNNAAYCAEIEYILFGKAGSTNTDNVKTAYQKIFMIKYPLNLVSGYINFWSSNNITSAVIRMISDTVAGATGGIVPAPVVKAVLIPIFTIFETITDLDRLEAGFPCELYKKDAEDWWCGFSSVKNIKSVGAFMSAMDGSSHANTDSGFFYSDYMTLFFLTGLKSRCAADMYERMGEVIEKNIQNLGDDDFSMKKARVYFRFDAKLRTEPLIITLPIFKDPEYGNNLEEKTDWCTYKIDIIRGY